jgi:mannose-6-phosphate isomerase-like protein (cupin superfamily)
MKIVSKNNPLKHSQWSDNCDCWNLVDENALSVKLERMPPHTAEEKHFHEKSQQFFYILKGEAVFEIELESITVKQEQGIYIEPGKQHRIINENDEDLEFLLSSQPTIANDRINIE